MKHCPNCNKSYPADSLNFCLDDGFILTNDPEATLVIPEFHDRAGIQELSHDPTRSVARIFLSSTRLYIALLALLMIALIVGVIVYLKRVREIENAQNRVEQLQIEVTSLKRKISELESKLATVRPSNITGISYVRTDSGILNDDIYFANDSGKDLHDVNVIITLTAADGVDRREMKFFGLWLNGEQVYARVISGKPQKGTMRGLCDEGRINLAWTP
jgi:cell division protein FtsB